MIVVFPYHRTNHDTDDIISYKQFGTALHTGVVSAQPIRKVGMQLMPVWPCLHCHGQGRDEDHKQHTQKKFYSLQVTAISIPTCNHHLIGIV